MLHNPADFLKRVRIGILKYYFKLKKPKPTLVMERRWDNLIVLDACRFDVFKYVCPIRGHLEKIISAGPNTYTWVKRNFYTRDKKFSDTIYISSNPYISNYSFLHGISSLKPLGFIPFFKIVDVWRFGWNEELQTVPPWEVNKVTRMIKQRYPDKKLIIHYIQPHHPFIGRVRIREADGFDMQQLRGRKNLSRSAWHLLQQGKLSLSKLVRAYVSNLCLVLGYVMKLLPELDGLTCITSDHGNAFGRFGIYSHPNIELPELIEVPWLEVKKL